MIIFKKLQETFNQSVIPYYFSESQNTGSEKNSKKARE